MRFSCRQDLKTGAPVDNVDVKEDVVAKKRNWISSEEMANQKLPKRLRIESTGRLEHDGRYPKKTVLVHKCQKKLTPRQMTRSELLLENQRLRLESKYKNELHKLEKDKLKKVIELRTENRLLKKEVARIDKENQKLRSRRENHWGLGKREIERRRKNFPWLPIYTSEDKTKVQSSQSKKGSIEWDGLPSNVASAILNLLPDEDLFVLRGLSTQFYDAFYSQEDHVHCERCIWLAKRGRKFANLRFIHAFDEFTWKEFRVLGPSNFPNLEVIWLENSSPRLMKPHPQLREVQFIAREYDDLQWVSEKKFPALEILIFSTDDEMYGDHMNRLSYLPDHKNLTHFGFDFCEPSLEEIRELTKARFPKLHTMGITGEAGEVPEVLQLLQLHGIHFTDNIKEFSLNKSSFRD